MKNLKRVLCAAALSLSLSSSLAFACSCIIPGTPTEELEKSDAVFSGIVTNIQNNVSYGLDVSFQVEQSWKGEVGSEIQIHTGFGAGDCGYPFESGVKYLVFAYESEGVYEAGTCGLTQRLSEADETLKELGSGQALPINEEDSAISKRSLQSIALVSIVVLLGLAFVTRIKKRKS